MKNPFYKTMTLCYWISDIFKQSFLNHISFRTILCEKQKQKIIIILQLHTGWSMTILSHIKILLWITVRSTRSEAHIKRGWFKAGAWRQESEKTHGFLWDCRSSGNSGMSIQVLRASWKCHTHQESISVKQRKSNSWDSKKALRT